MSEWISVKDRLPEFDGVKVLIAFEEYYGDQGVCMAYFNMFKDTGHEGQDHGPNTFLIPNSDSDYGGLFEAYKVTHWMEMPELPVNK